MEAQIIYVDFIALSGGNRRRALCGFEREVAGSVIGGNHSPQASAAPLCEGSRTALTQEWLAHHRLEASPPSRFKRSGSNAREVAGNIAARRVAAAREEHCREISTGAGAAVGETGTPDLSGGGEFPEVSNPGHAPGNRQETGAKRIDGVVWNVVEAAGKRMKGA